MFRFAITAVIIFYTTFTFLGVFGLLPVEIQAKINTHPLRVFGGNQVASAYEAVKVNEEAPITYTPSGVKEFPVHIKIPAIGVDARILNPESSSVAVLDEALRSGAVRYPTSGVLNEAKNIFLFGHSSYLKVVHNSAYRTFNNLKNLKAGDEIQVDGAEHSYVYRVTTVSLLKDSEAVVDIGGSGRMLTLSTCDTFGKKEDRIVVSAEFMRSF